MIFERTFTVGSTEARRVCTLTIGAFRTCANGDSGVDVAIRGLFAGDWQVAIVGIDPLQAFLHAVRIARAKLESAPEFGAGELRWLGHPGHGLGLIAE